MRLTKCALRQASSPTIEAKRAVCIPIEATAREPINGPDTYQRLPKLRRLGHSPRIISAIYVKPFTKGQKNDYNDAEAIAEAALRWSRTAAYE